MEADIRKQPLQPLAERVLASFRKVGLKDLTLENRARVRFFFQLRHTDCEKICITGREANLGMIYVNSRNQVSVLAAIVGQQTKDPTRSWVGSSIQGLRLPVIDTLNVLDRLRWEDVGVL